MSAGLPKTIDIRKFADNGRHLQGTLDWSQCHRLIKLIDGCDSDIQVVLDFERTAQGERWITGQITGTVLMICQRCLEPTPVILDCEVSLGAVESEEQADRLSEHLEPLMLSDDPVDLAELLEDELLLALPVVARHDHCDAPIKLAEAEKEATEPERKNPFAALKNLKV